MLDKIKQNLNTQEVKKVSRNSEKGQGNDKSTYHPNC